MAVIPHPIALRWVAVAVACGMALRAGGMEKPVPVENRAEFQGALQALADGLPQVAAVKWERLLTAGRLGPQDAGIVASRMVDALLRARMGAQALQAISAHHPPEEDFWKGQAHLELEQFREAERSFLTYLERGKRPYWAYAKLALGKAIIAQTRENTGRKEIKDMVDDRDPEVARLARVWSNESELISFPERSAMVLRRMIGPERLDPEVEFVRGCAFLCAGDGHRAQSSFNWIVERKTTVPDRLREAALVRRAEAVSTLGRTAFSRNLLLEYLGAPQRRYFYEAAFALLRKVADAEPDDDDIPSHLHEWIIAGKVPERHALALYHYADWLVEKGRRREAIPYIEEFLRLYPGHARESEAIRLAMECHGSVGDDERVLELAKVWREKFSSSTQGTVDYLTAMIRFGRKEYPEAQKLFQKAADAALKAGLKQRAIYNLALSALLRGSLSEFNSCQVQLQKVGENTNAADDDAFGEDPSAKLSLERALHMASRHDTNAEAALKEFLKAYPAHPRAVEAELALAEFCLLADSPRPKAAESYLNAARARKNVPDEWKERTDYTEMWLREAKGDLPGAAEQGQVFLRQWPKSRRREEVRMKVAQSYYRLEEYTKALAQFDQLIEESPDSSYAEAARFFAGKAALALMNEAGLEKAIERWSEVAEHGGPLAVEARRQQALVKRRQGKNGDALAVTDAILTGKPAPQGDQRLSLLLDKGELLLISAKSDPKHIDDAVSIFRQVQQDTTASREWRSRAGVLLSQAYQSIGKTPEALEACYDVVQSNLSQGLTQLTPADYLWLYRAGFFALDLLEAREDWSGAARLADRLAEAGGDRSEEAKTRATNIRLAHFLWDK